MRTLNYVAVWIVAVMIGYAVSGCSDAIEVQTSTITESAHNAIEEDASPLFVDATESLGLAFRHTTGAKGACLMPEIMGSGVALFDFDRDGDLDAYLVNGGESVSTNASNSASNELWRQNDDGRFENVTGAIGAGDGHYGMGVAVGDVNNDGWPDLFLTNYGQDQLYVNDAGQRFVNVTEASGLMNERWSVSAAFADIDRDGRLDLYVANYVDFDPSLKCVLANGLPDYCNPQRFPGTTDSLFVQTQETADVDGVTVPKFANVSVTSGIASARGAGMGVALIDANQDGWVDWYVANDMTANFLWINQKDGTFVDDAIAIGIALDGTGKRQASMGIAVADIDCNGHEDIFLTHMSGESNTLYLQQQTSIFDDATHVQNLGHHSFAETGFGVAAFDLEHDGDLDLAIVNGKVTLATETQSDNNASTDLRNYGQHNQLFVQQPSGKFTSHFSSAGFGRDRFVTRGLAAGDVDNDGDIDLLINNSDETAQIWLNEIQSKGNWIRLRLQLPKYANRDAIGAVATIRVGQMKFTRRLAGSGSYGSAHPNELHFGLGESTALDSVIVQWPDGAAEEFLSDRHDLSANRSVTLQKGTGNVLEDQSK